MKSLKTRLKNMMEELKTQNLDKEKIAGYISDLGKEKFIQAKKVIQEYIRDEDFNVRYNAWITLLIDFKAKDLYSVAKKIALTDPYTDVRGAAIAGLGSIKRATRDKDTLLLFLDIVLRYKGKDDLEDDERESFNHVRDSAYRAIFSLLGIHPNYSPPPGVFYDRKEFFDPEFLNIVDKYAHNKIKNKDLDQAIRIHLKKFYKIELDKNFNFKKVRKK